MIRNPSVTARHELKISEQLDRFGFRAAGCSCGQWESQGSNVDQLVEDYQVHRDFIDEAQRLKTQRLERAAARAMNTGAK